MANNILINGKVVITYMLLMMASFTAISQHVKKRKTIDDKFEKFDIADFENKRDHSLEGGNNQNHFHLQNGTEIFRAAYKGYYTDERILPKPSFLKQNREFYLSGFIKVKGLSFGSLAIGANGIKVGKWIYFDEMGKILKVVDEDSKFGKFGYQELLAFLNREGLVNIKTGKNRDKVKAFFEKSEHGNKTWTVEVITEFLADNYSRGWKYKLDGDSGKLLDKAKINISFEN